ncbi:hypothetical protein HN789_07410 [archaeon]|nr:hypothetical protein [archaeon]MBT4858879.1 hypothetical protein [archaeon]MBT7441044.1 hypothetical protein [archaeon]
MRSLRADIWTAKNFEEYRGEVLSELEREVGITIKQDDESERKIEITTQIDLSEEVKQAKVKRRDRKRLTKVDFAEHTLNLLTDLYGPEIHSNGPGSLNDNYLLDFVIKNDDFAHLITGLEYELPLEVLLHLTREEMKHFFVGVGKVATYGWQKFFVSPPMSDEVDLIEIIHRYVSVGNNNKLLKNKDRIHYVRRYDHVVADVTIPERTFSYMARNGKKNGNRVQNMMNYLRSNGKTKNIEADRLEHPEHLKLKKQLKRQLRQKRGNTWFEVLFNSSNGFKIPVDAARVYDDGAILYECKSSSRGNHFEEGRESLREAAKFVYYNFGILPRLELVTKFGLLPVELPSVNPFYEGKLKPRNRRKKN